MIIHKLALALLMLTLISCGQTGPLTLPHTPPVTIEQPKPELKEPNNTQ